MPHSLRVRLKNLQRKGELTEKDIDRIFKALSQESCDDAISRKWLLDSKRTVYITDRFDGRTSAYISKKTVEDATSVTQKSGKWLNKDDFIYALRTCGFSVYHGQIMYAEDDLIQRFNEMIESEG